MVLNDERIASLNALGFEWAVIERRAIKSFEQRIEDLQAYNKEKNGHINEILHGRYASYLRYMGKTRDMGRVYVRR